MPIINTAELDQAALAKLSHAESYQIYNGLDCCVTMEVFQVLHEELRQGADPGPSLVYDFVRGMQAPALDMMTRGFKVDLYERKVALDQLGKNRVRLQSILDKYTVAIWGKTLNVASPKQMKLFFYHDPSGLNLPEQHKLEKGTRKVSTDRNCLEKLLAYFYATPIILCILAIRDVEKKISVLTSEVDSDGRMRTSYNVAGTETERWSSSANAFGSGTNLQNITPELRKVFISDPGYKLCYLDLEQAESYVTGLLVWQTVGDEAYLAACKSGDLHTSVAKLVWPSLPWTGDRKDDRKIADKVFYRQFSFRDMAKRGGHATNYYGQPPTIARHLKIEARIVAEFQGLYFKAFPGIPEWHRWVAHQLGVSQCITTPLGNRRHFFGRPGDDATLREAIAYSPQSVVGQLLNAALWRTWHAAAVVKTLPGVQMLGQVHDAHIFQYKEEFESQVLPAALELAKVPLTVGGLYTALPGSKFPSNTHERRTLVIPSECKIGWNWSDDEIKTSTGEKIKNPNGLIKWKGAPDGRTRVGGLDRLVS